MRRGCIMRAFDKLPREFQNDEVRVYYDILQKKRASIVLKRIFDIFISLVLHVQAGEGDEVRKGFSYF